jgi:hypothetical protein
VLDAGSRRLARGSLLKVATLPFRWIEVRDSMYVRPLGVSSSVAMRGTRECAFRNGCFCCIAEEIRRRISDQRERGRESVHGCPWSVWARPCVQKLFLFRATASDMEFLSMFFFIWLYRSAGPNHL